MDKVKKFLNLYGAWAASHFRPRAISIRMIPTDRCNLNCGYCWQKREDGREMSSDEFQSYLSHARKLGVGIITFLGGEPMIWPGLYEAIASCTKANILTDLTTNGSLLDSKTIERLGKAGLDYLNISVDGLEATQISSKNSIAQKQTLSLLKAARKTYGMHFRMNSVICRNNFDQIKAMIEFARLNNVQISLGFVVPALGDTTCSNSEIHFREEDHDMLAEMVEYIIGKKKSGYPIIDPEEYFRGVFKFVKREKFWDCNYPGRYGWVNISPSGKVRSCTKKMDELEYHFLELDSEKLTSLRQTLGRKVAECNVHCYSNCAFDSYYYAHHKIAFAKKILDRMRNNHRRGD